MRNSDEKGQSTLSFNQGFSFKFSENNYNPSRKSCLEKQLSSGRPSPVEPLLQSRPLHVCVHMYIHTTHIYTLRNPKEMLGKSAFRGRTDIHYGVPRIAYLCSNERPSRRCSGGQPKPRFVHIRMPFFGFGVH